MNIDWKPAMDGGLAVVGGSLLDTLLANVQAIADFTSGFPEIFGINLKLVAYGALALVVVKNFIMKQL